jgi:hypothetical protein
MSWIVAMMSTETPLLNFLWWVIIDSAAPEPDFPWSLKSVQVFLLNWNIIHRPAVGSSSSSSSSWKEESAHLGTSGNVKSISIEIDHAMIWFLRANPGRLPTWSRRMIPPAFWSWIVVSQSKVLIHIERLPKWETLIDSQDAGVLWCTLYMLLIIWIMGSYIPGVTSEFIRKKHNCRCLSTRQKNFTTVMGISQCS